MELQCDTQHPMADTPLPLSTPPFQMCPLSELLSGIPSPYHFLKLAPSSCGEAPLSLPALPVKLLNKFLKRLVCFYPQPEDIKNFNF